MNTGASTKGTQVQQFWAGGTPHSLLAEAGTSVSPAVSSDSAYHCSHVLEGKADHGMASPQPGMFEMFPSHQQVLLSDTNS